MNDDSLASGGKRAPYLDPGKARRRSIRCPAIVKWSDGTTYRTCTLDLSPECVSIALDKRVSEKSLCQITFVALTSRGAHQFTANCTVRYCVLSGLEGFRVGLGFLDLVPQDSHYLEELCSRGRSVQAVMIG